MDSALSASNVDLLLQRRSNSQRSASRPAPDAGTDLPSVLQRNLSGLSGGDGGRRTSQQGEQRRDVFERLLNDRTPAASDQRQPGSARPLGSSQSSKSTSRLGDWSYSLYYHSEGTGTACGGKIGNSDTFCLATKPCGTDSHSRSPHSFFLGDRMYLMASKGQSKDKAIAVGECRYEMTIAQVVSRRDLIAQVNIILGGCDSEDRAIAEFLNFTVRAQDLLDVSADIANTASFGEINGMDTAREQLDDGSSDEDRQFGEMEDVISEPDDRNGNLQRDMSAESLSEKDRFLVRVLDSQETKIDALIRANEVLLGRVRSLEVAKTQMQDLYMRKDKWVGTYRRDAYNHVNLNSPDLRGVADNAVNLNAIDVRVERLESPNQDAGGQQLSLESMQADLILMGDRLGSDSVTFGETTLSSYADTLLFVTSAMDSETCSYGFFYDMVALMEAVVDPQTDMSTHLKNEFESQRTNYSSVMEASTSTSFFRIAPLVLSGTTSKTSALQQAHGSMDRMFGAVKNRSDWSNTGGTHGLKTFLDVEMGNVFLAAREAIKLNLTGPNARAAVLANEFLIDSRDCYTSFVTWTESFYLEIKDMSDVTEKEAWALILQCWGAFFGELRKIRSVAAGQNRIQSARNVSARTQRAAFNIYTMGRAIKKQREFIAAGFKNHSVIATVINYHLFQHRVPSSTFDAHTKMMNAWKTEITRIVKKLQDRAGS